MHRAQGSPAIRIASAILGLLLCALILLSSFYLAAEAAHDCTHEDCPVCATMELCQQVLQQLGSAAPALVLRLLPILFLLLTGAFLLRLIPSITPVSAKVRLNN